MFDLSPCRLGSLTNLGHNAYELRHCSTCAGAYAACAVCPSLGDLCPGCRWAEVRRQIAAGKVVFPDMSQAWREGNAPTAVALVRADPHVSDQAGERTHGDQGNGKSSTELYDQGSGKSSIGLFDQAGAVGELAHGGESAPCTEPTPSTDQAVTVDAGGRAVYNPAAVGQSHNGCDAPGLGAPPVDTITSPLVLLVLPVDLASVQPVLEALAPVMASQGRNGGHNGHLADTPALPPLPRHLAKKCYLSDTACPHGHTHRDSGKVLRYHGSHMCTQCAAQAKPKRTAASQEG